MQRKYDSMFSEFEVELPVWVTIVGLAMLGAVAVAGVTLVAMYIKRRSGDD